MTLGVRRAFALGIRRCAAQRRAMGKVSMVIDNEEGLYKDKRSS